MTEGEKKAALFVGSTLVIGGIGLLVIPKFIKSSVSNGTVSAVVDGYIGPSQTSPSKAISVPIGQAFSGQITVKNQTTSATTLGVRAWIVIPPLGSSSLQEAGVDVTTVGHLFTSPGTVPGATGASVAQLSLSPGQSISAQLFSAELAAPSSIGSDKLGVLWAVGPISEVTNLPYDSGQLPVGSGIIYIYTPNVVTVS